MSGKGSVTKVKTNASFNSTNSTAYSEEEFELSELLLEKFIALNPLYYIDEEEELEDQYRGKGFSNENKEG